MKGFGWGKGDTDKIGGSFGRLVPNMEAKIVSEDGTELGPGQIGELCLRGIDLHDSYLINRSDIHEVILPESGCNENVNLPVAYLTGVQFETDGFTREILQCI